MILNYILMKNSIIVGLLSIVALGAVGSITAPAFAGDDYDDDYKDLECKFYKDDDHDDDDDYKYLKLKCKKD
jgi:hypothetical protein